MKFELGQILLPLFLKSMPLLLLTFIHFIKYFMMLKMETPSLSIQFPINDFPDFLVDFFSIF